MLSIPSILGEMPIYRNDILLSPECFCKGITLSPQNVPSHFLVKFGIRLILDSTLDGRSRSVLYDMLGNAVLTS